MTPFDPPFDVMLARLLLGAAGSLAAGGAAWAVILLCRRCLPALDRQRSTWLLAQAAVVAVFVAAQFPAAERLRIAPVIEMEAPVAVAAAAASTPPAARPLPASAPVPAPAAPVRHAWLRDAARAWLALYLLGLGHALLRWRRAQRLLDALAAGGEPLTAPERHAGCAGRDPAALPAVIEVEAPISPMLQGLARARLLLPRHLRSADPLQQRLIVEHELTHWRRHDLVWSAAALFLQTLFWFNPFMRMLRARLEWAQEFGCDRAVLQARPQRERKAYAMALVAQLKLQQQEQQEQRRRQQRCAATALGFGAGDAPTLGARIDLIRTPGAPAGAWPRCAALASLTAVVCTNLALQPALGWQGDGVPGSSAQLLERAWRRMSSATPRALDCTVMLDAASGATLVREGTCDARVTPGSTFKIAISLMGFDSGVLKGAHLPYLPYKPAYESANPSWRHGTDPAGWLRESIVWYSQQVTARLGAARVRSYVQAFGYGNRELASVDGVDDAVALSEVSPSLKISPLEETAFLRKLVNRSLPVSAYAYDMTARLLELDTPANGWKVHGKTGTAPARLADGSADPDQDIGWFVGWASKGGRTLVFARLLQHPAQATHHRGGALTRAAFLDELARRRL